MLQMEFNDLSTTQRTALAAAAAVELGAKTAAFVDLARRDSGAVRGPKWVWGLALFINGFGPAAYWALARR